MSASILDTIKKMVGPDTDDTFNDEIVVHINAALTTLAQVGACPKGSSISSSADTWDSIFPTANIANKAKTYIYYKVRLGFDPPQSSFVMENMKELAEEELWRINSDADYDEDDDE